MARLLAIAQAFGEVAPNLSIEWKSFAHCDALTPCYGLCGRFVGGSIMMISLGIVAVMVFIAVSAVHTSRVP
jgi:hypothetical protein